MIQTKTVQDVELAPIPGFDGYWATDDGRIWSDPKYGVHHGKFLSPQRHRNGYLFVNLYVGGGKIYHRYIHRLVLESWVGPCPQDMECNHRDNCKTNNKLSNLEWTTPKGNSEHKCRQNRQTVGELYEAHKLTGARVIAIRSRLINGESIRKLAREYGVSRPTIRDIKTGRTWVHIHDSEE